MNFVKERQYEDKELEIETQERNQTLFEFNAIYHWYLASSKAKAANQSLKIEFQLELSIGGDFFFFSLIFGS